MTIAMAVAVLSFSPTARADVDSLPGEPVGEHIVVNESSAMTILTPGAAPRYVGESAAGDRPAWSPDAGSLVFSRSSPSSPPELFVAELGGPARQLTSGHTYGGAGTPAWAPDGRTIAFTSSGQTQTPLFALPDPNAEVFVIRPDGTGEARLSSQLATAAQPAWAPDGSALAVTGATAADSFYQILVLDPTTGAETRRLTNDLEGNHMHPAWSPDGRTVAYAISPRSDLVHGYLPWVLAVVGADGTNPHVIASDAEGRYLYAPTWTPDGRIVYGSASGTSNDTHLEVMNADGTGRHVLTGLLYNAVPAVAPVLFTDTARDTDATTPATRPGDPPARPAATPRHPLDLNGVATSLPQAGSPLNDAPGSSDSAVAATADLALADQAPRGGQPASANSGGALLAAALLGACVLVALSLTISDRRRRARRVVSRS